MTNTGNVTWSDVTVVDDQGITVTCPQTALDPGAAMTCNATGIATTGQYANLATATARTPEETQVTDTDPSHYFGTQAVVSDTQVVVASVNSQVSSQVTLPATGADIERLSSIGLLLFGLGAAVVFATRRNDP